MEFKDRLTQARLAKGMTRREAGIALGWADDSGYRKYEVGARVPNIELAAQMANMLDVSIDWLVGLSADMPNRAQECTETFCNNLKNARAKANMTQKNLADAVGLYDDSAVRPYESGKRLPSVELAARMADALNVSLDWLAGLSSDPEIHSRIPLETKNEE